MIRKVVRSKVGSDGILHLELPLGIEDAGREVQVTVEPLPAGSMSPEDWDKGILATAGKWQGDFERPDQGEYEKREPLS
jgi:hypothetical protein